MSNSGWIHSSGASKLHESNTIMYVPLFPNCIGLYLLNSLVPTDIVQFMTKSYLCSVAIGQAKITLLSKHQAPETGSDLHKEKGQPRVVHLKNL